MRNKIFITLCVGLLTLNSIQAQAPANSNAIMLQAFYWDSNAATSWSQLYNMAGDISGYFDYAWLPPSAFSSGGTGYHPKQWSNQESAWGSAEKLKQLINYLKSHNCKAIADIVVNHRDNVSNWCDFYPDNFGTYGSFQFTSAHICRDDEANYDSKSECKGQITGANDTGEKYGAARDLDHTNTYVRNAVKAYLKWMRNEMGYSGWRYDVAKGFSAQYFGEYNDAGGAEISVGEYWDGDYNALWNWVNGTGKKSMAFDFAFKFSALNGGLASNSYGNMAWMDGSTPRPAGLVHSPQSRRYAVTFIDNHDTYREASKYNGDVQKANAFMLSSPGIPCVFYPHWRDNKTAIQNMMKARKAVGLHSESDVQVQNTSGYYKAYGKGTCGEMLTFIGSNNSQWAGDAPNGGGWTLNCSGTGWAIYTKIDQTSCNTAYQQKITNGVNPPPCTKFTSLTITAEVPAAWTAPKIHAWVIGGAQITTGAWPGQAMTKVSGNKFTITFSGFAETCEVGVVINNGAASGTLQTIDLTATEKNTCWTIENAPTVGSKYNATKCANVAIDYIEESLRTAIYPNPAQTELRIYTSETIVLSEIQSVAGQRIKSFTGKQVSVADLSAGIYLLTLYKADGSLQTLKFIKE